MRDARILMSGRPEDGCRGWYSMAARNALACMHPRQSQDAAVESKSRGVSTLGNDPRFHLGASIRAFEAAWRIAFPPAAWRRNWRVTERRGARPEPKKTSHVHRHTPAVMTEFATSYRPQKVTMRADSGNVKFWWIDVPSLKAPSTLTCAGRVPF